MYIAASSASGAPSNMVYRVAFSVPNINGQSPSFISGADVAKEDCHSVSGCGYPSYHTGRKSAAMVASG